MADGGILRTPLMTPAKPAVGSGLFPPPLDASDDEMASERTQANTTGSAGRPTPVSSARPSPFGLFPSSTAVGSAADETDPLLNASHTAFQHRHYKPHSPTVQGRLLDFVGVPTHLTVTGMLAALLKLFLPATATTLLYFSNQAITMMFVGRMLGTDELAYYSVGISVFNICGLSIGLGLSTALDTLCSQAYGRDPNTPEVGLLLQRGFIVCLGAAAPIVATFFVMEPGLQAVFGPALGTGIAVFLRASPSYLVALVVNYCLQKALQAQQVTDVPVVASILSALSCPLLNYYLTPHGVGAAAHAIGLSVWVSFVVNVLGAMFHPRSIIGKCPWPATDAWSLSGFREFLAVGVPGMMSIVAEWWAFEFIITLAAQHGEAVVTGFTICVNVVTFLYAVPAGLAVAVGVLCGNFLGANDPRGARSFARMTLLLEFALLGVAVALLLAFGENVFRLYTRDEHVLRLMRDALWLLAVFHVGDALQSVNQGVFRGVGRQGTSARIVVVALWCIGLPASWLLGNRMKPLEGILAGLCVGFAVEVPLMWYDMLWRWDWEEMAEQAAQQGAATTAGTAAVAGSGLDKASCGSSPSVTTGKPVGYGTTDAPRWCEVRGGDEECV